MEVFRQVRRSWGTILTRELPGLFRVAAGPTSPTSHAFSSGPFLKKNGSRPNQGALRSSIMIASFVSRIDYSIELSMNRPWNRRLAALVIVAVGAGNVLA